MDDVGALWLSICILTIVVVTVIAVLFIVTWQKIDLVYDIVRKKKLCGECKYYSNGFCYNPNTFNDEKTYGNTVPDWYCADGKRRETND